MDWLLFSAIALAFVVLGAAVAWLWIRVSFLEDETESLRRRVLDIEGLHIDELEREFQARRGEA